MSVTIKALEVPVDRSSLPVSLIIKPASATLMVMAKTRGLDFGRTNGSYPRPITQAHWRSSSSSHRLGD